MYCRLLDDLETQARTAPDRVSWARAACKIAVHRARQGQLDEAQALIQRVRDTFGVELHHEIAPWVMLAEGVIHYFRLDMRMSWERLRRAYALAVALRLESAKATCSAWMAAIALQRSSYDEMAKFLVETFEQSDSESHHARGRASSVIAVAIHMAGSYELARPWYDKARLYAAAEGDQALISAMLFNVAVCRIASLLMADLSGAVSEKELLRARMEIDSSRTYDCAVGAVSFKDLTVLARGHLCLLARDFNGALEFFGSIERSRLPAREIPVWLASCAWCLLNVGRLEEAWAEACLSEEALTKASDTDDFAYVYGRLVKIADSCGRFSELNRLKQLAAEKYSCHESEQSAALVRLTEVTRIISGVLGQKKSPA